MGTSCSVDTKFQLGMRKTFSGWTAVTMVAGQGECTGGRAVLFKAGVIITLPPHSISTQEKSSTILRSGA